MHVTVTCRALIIKNNKLLAVEQQGGFYALPGGTLDPGETLDECICREIKEELNFDAKNTKLVVINELKKGEKHRIEFFYTIGNPEEFDMEKAKNASHSYELLDIKRVDIDNPEVQILPKQAIDLAAKQSQFTEIYKITNIADA